MVEHMKAENMLAMRFIDHTNKEWGATIVFAVWKNIPQPFCGFPTIAHCKSTGRIQNTQNT